MKGTEAGAVDGKGAVARTPVWTRRGKAGAGQSLARCKSGMSPGLSHSGACRAGPAPGKAPSILGSCTGCRRQEGQEGGSQAALGSAGLGVSADAHAHVCTGSGFRAYTGHPSGWAWGGACIQVASEGPLG